MFLLNFSCYVSDHLCVLNVGRFLSSTGQSVTSLKDN